MLFPNIFLFLSPNCSRQSRALLLGDLERHDFMTNQEDISEAELEALFLDDDRRFAVQMLDNCRRENMWRYIKSLNRRFDQDDIHDVYNKALGEFIKCAKKPDFDPKAPLRLLQRIIKFRAIDHARKKYRARAKTIDALIEPLAADLADTKRGFLWRYMNNESKVEFRRALDAAIDELTPKQRNVSIAMLEVYDQIRSDDSPRALAARIYELTGEDCTASQAADRWVAARNNLKTILMRAGIKDPLEDLQ